MLETALRPEDRESPTFKANKDAWVALVRDFRESLERVRQGGGPKAVERQHKKGRLTARERIQKLIDPGTEFYELMAFAGWGMYEEWGGAPAGGVITGIGRIAGRDWMIVANDATVKAGAFFPITAKKVIRAQTIALENRIPTVYLVDSAGVFLPLQDEVFPDQDDFGRIFYLNARMSALGIPQISAIMGNCVAGGAYLPVMTDVLIMTEGSGLYLAGPQLVKAAIGQEIDQETLDELEHAFKFNDAVLRHLIIKMPKAMTAPSPMMREEKSKSMLERGAEPRAAEGRPADAPA